MTQMKHPGCAEAARVLEWLPLTDHRRLILRLQLRPRLVRQLFRARAELGVVARRWSLTRQLVSMKQRPFIDC